MLYGNCRVTNIQSSQPEHMLWRHNCEVHIRETEGKLLSKELLLDVKEEDNLRTQQCFRELLLEELPHKTRNSIPCITVGQTIKTQNEEITAKWKSTETKESSCQKSCSLMSRKTATYDITNVVNAHTSKTRTAPGRRTSPSCQTEPQLTQITMPLGAPVRRATAQDS